MTLLEQTARYQHQPYRQRQAQIAEFIDDALSGKKILTSNPLMARSLHAMHVAYTVVLLVPFNAWNNTKQVS